MDNQLPFMTRLRMKLHYIICVWCERYAQQIAFVKSAARSFPEHFTVLASEAEGISAERKNLLRTELAGDV
jgi:hypothetical protein